MKAIRITEEDLTLLHRLKRELFKRSKSLGPDGGLDRYDFVYGFFLGAGFRRRRAERFALLVTDHQFLYQLPVSTDPKTEPRRTDAEVALRTALNRIHGMAAIGAKLETIQAACTEALLV
jgi:hypothetical protein